ncbi:hypothetical protein Tsubulata_023794, partial [Turnera subulata]
PKSYCSSLQGKKTDSRFQLLILNRIYGKQYLMKWFGIRESSPFRALCDKGN